MMADKHRACWVGAALVVAICLLVGGSAQAATKRILILGDSWAQFLCGDAAFHDELIAKGLGDFVEWNNPYNNTAIGGTDASAWAADVNGMLTSARTELANEPTIDIVWVSLGGNDLFRTGVRYWQPLDEADVTLSQVTESVRVVTEALLAIRPDLRIAISSYDYMNMLKRYDLSNPADQDQVDCYNFLHANFPDAWAWPNLATALQDPSFPSEIQKMTPTQAQIVRHVLNMGGVMFAHHQIDMTLAVNAQYPGRCAFVNNYGILQYTYCYPGGVDGKDIPWWVPNWSQNNPGWEKYETHWDPNGVDHFRFGPGGCPKPGKNPPDYTPFPGGDTTFMKSPWLAMMYPPIDHWIHLSKAGHDAVAANCIDQVIGDWLLHPLGNPKLSGIALVDHAPNDKNQVRFRAMFGHRVTGVSESSFDLSGPAARTASIVDVAPEIPAGSQPSKDGEVSQYIITVQLGQASGQLVLSLSDYASIVNGGGRSLDAPTGATGQASFEAVGVSTPLAAAPIAVVLLVAGAFVTRGRRRR